MAVAKLTTEEFCRLGQSAGERLEPVWEKSRDPAQIVFEASRRAGIDAAVVYPANDTEGIEEYRTYVALVGAPERGPGFLEALGRSWIKAVQPDYGCVLGNENVAVVFGSPEDAGGRRETQIRVASEVFGSYEELAERVGGVVVGPAAPCT